MARGKPAAITPTQARVATNGASQTSLPSNHAKPSVGSCTSIAIFNQSGGVGKTTLVRDVGFELARLGLRVLLIDADPQGTLGVFLGESPAAKTGPDLFWSEICAPHGPEKSPTIVTNKFGLDVGLANRKLVTDEWTLAQQHDPARLLSILDGLRPQYDFILIDCPPKISEITIQVLLAVDSLLIPVQTEGKSVVAFAEVQYEIAQAQQRRKHMRLPALQVMGLVPTLHNPHLVLHRHHLQELQERLAPTFGYEVFPPVRDYVAVAEAGTRGMPLRLANAKCPAVQDIETLTQKILLKRQS
ncbi:MAG: ParA family protein [Blastocatellia bacterium]|nr:ParA family protein [Blastocatellia bacterium]